MADQPVIEGHTKVEPGNGFKEVTATKEARLLAIKLFNQFGHGGFYPPEGADDASGDDAGACEVYLTLGDLARAISSYRGSDG